MANRRDKPKRKKRGAQYVRPRKPSRFSRENVIWHRVVTVVALLALLLGGGGFLLLRGVREVRRVLLEGNSRYELRHFEISGDGSMSEERLRALSGICEGTNLLSIRFDVLERRMERNSLVESVHLERHLPDTLVVRVKERVPVARIEGIDSTYCIDRFGVALPLFRSATSLPLIKGTKARFRRGELVNDARVGTALKIIALCNSTVTLGRYLSIESLDVRYSDYVLARLKNGVWVKIPPRSLRTKLRDLATSVKLATEQGRSPTTIDLTPDRPAVFVRETASSE